MIWHWIFLPETTKEMTKGWFPKYLMPKTLYCAMTPFHANTQSFQGFGLLFLVWVLHTLQHSSAQHTPQQHRWAPNTCTTQPHSVGAWSNLPSIIQGLCNEQICRNLPTNFYTNLFLRLLPNQVLKRKWLKDRTCPLSWQFVLAANHSCF